MTFRERVEASPVGWLVGVGAASFVAGLLVMLGVMQVLISDRGPRDRPIAENTPQLGPTAIKGTSIRSATPADSGNIEMTSQQFVRRYMALDGRYGEQEAFIQKADRKRVRWQVVFTGPASFGETLAVYFDVPNESPHAKPLERGPVRWATFPMNLHDRVYALKRGDLIEIAGVLKKLSNYQLEIQAGDFDVILTSTPMPGPTH